MFKWLKDRWNYLVGKNVEKQEEQFPPTGNYTYAISVSPATTTVTDGEARSDAGGAGSPGVPIADLSDEEFLKSVLKDLKPKKKSKSKKKSKKKGKKKPKKK